MITLSDLIAREGSQERAAHFLGVTLSTFRRWVAGKNISPMGRKVLSDNGVELSPLKSTPEFVK